MVSALLTVVLGLGQVEPVVQDRKWEVTRERSLSFDGSPYIPVGLHIDPTVEAMDQAVQAGVTDVFVELPLDLGTWRRVLPELESRGFRYLIGVSALAPSASVVAIEPKSYRVSGLMGRVDIKVDIPSGERAYGIFANERNGAVIWEGWLPIQAGKLPFRYDLGSDFPHVLVLYPEVKDQRMADYWEGFDLYRDQLLTILQNAPLGSGYRGLVNPAGKTVRSFQVDDTLVPTSKLFRLELETYLRQKYGTPDLVAASWHVGLHHNRSFEDFAACVPLWQGSRGVDSILNLNSGKVTSSERRDEIWSDIRTVVRSGAARRLNRLVDVISDTTGRPVFQDWSGWGGLYEDADGALAGISFRMDPRSAVDVLDMAAGPMSSVLRRGRPMTGLAVSVQLQEGETALDAGRVIRQSESLGTRGWFFNASSPELRTAVADAAETYRDQASMARNGVRPLYYPFAATNPAVTGRLPGGMVWIPSPVSGERLDLGPTIEGYRFVDRGVTTFVFWAISQPQRVKMRMSSEVVPTMVAIDGSDLLIKSKKNEVELTIPTTPVIVEGSSDIPVPLDGFYANQAAVSYLIDTFGKLIDLSGTELTNLKRTTSGFERTPLASYLAIRNQFQSMAVRAAPYNWLEAENPVTSNFSDMLDVSGTSGGKVLELNPKVKTVAPYASEYVVQNRLGGSHSIWIAAKMDEPARKALKISLAGQAMEMEPNPVSFYGSGFAWYRAGQLTLPPGQTRMWIRAETDEPINCQIDVIMVAPGEFRPNGVLPPTEWVWEALSQARPPARTGSRG